MKRVRIFIASPSDVQKERNMLNSLIDELNIITETCFGVYFDLAKWENAYPEMGRPQQIINTQLEVENCDIFIGVLWSRFGSDSGIKEIGSGTEEEFSIAYDHWKKYQSPQIMFYRCVKNFSAKVDTRQIQKVNNFFKEFKFDSAHPGLYVEYQSIKSLEINIRRALLLYACNHKEFDDKIPVLENGIEQFYTYQSNTLRMAAKAKEIESAQFVDLIAHSGHSFIANYGNRYRGIIEKHLQSGKLFRLIIENPWTFNVLLQVLSEKDSNSIVGQCLESPKGIKGFSEVLNIIRNSEWYTIKFADSINGFLSLKKAYGDRIQLRISKYEIPSSILITSSSCFIEPYLPISKFERQSCGMLLFETKVSCTSSIYKYATSYFNLMWNLSETYDVFEKNEDIFIKSLLAQEGELL